VVPEQLRVRKNVLTSAVAMFKTNMLTGIHTDFEEEIATAEAERRATIFAYDLTAAETAAFNRQIGYNPGLN
jgi:hypothetical protein